jgi:aspartyl-tRNA(Asn)/glutamyl-tRNA(Gln) amidotransferase subunit C
MGYRTGIRNQESFVMKITREEIVHVANLARLDLDEESIGKFAEQIDNILEYIDILNRVETEGVAPTSHAIFLTNAFREDKVKEHLDRNKALANAPEEEDGNFVVPKVIG